MRSISQQALAVVTGAGSGIGRAFALELALRGSKVVCSDINAESAGETAELIQQNGGTAWSATCDVSQREQVEALAATATRHLGAPATLIVNNAGIGVGGHAIEELSLEDWKLTIDINLWGVIHGCRTFLPAMKAQGRGGVINVASAASFAAAPFMGPYNVSKAGVLSLSETLAAEVAGSDIRIAVLCPSFVKTNIITNGRIPPATSGTASRLMASTGVSAESVVRKTLKALDRGQLYVVPQRDARAIWWIKRMAPAMYTRGAGFLGRRIPSAETNRKE